MSEEDKPISLLTSLFESGDERKSVTAEKLKKIVKTALGDKYTDEEILQSLEEMGVPREGKIDFAEFCEELSTPTPQALTYFSDSSIGSWLTTEEWQKALGRLGVDLTLEETEVLVEKTRKRAWEDIVREKLALEKIGVHLNGNQIGKLVEDVCDVCNREDDSSDYETEEEFTIVESV